jgi:UPF0176 protein
VVREAKVLLYYCFTPLADPEAIHLWQRVLCESLGLRGRIIISRHGINGTVGGDLLAIKKYLKGTKAFLPFKHIDFKWSEGTGREFPRLEIKIRDEIVSFGATGELEVDESGVVGGGQHLTPEAVHELVAARGEEVVFFDGRNSFEAAIGRFKNAVVPDVATTRDFVREIDSGAYDHLKNKAIVTYCTGGVRCEVLSSIMKRRGFSEVYQIEGGVVRYGEAFGDDGLWEGSLYLFDGRMNQEFSDHSLVISSCERCDAPTSKYHNCSNGACRKLILLCADCATAPSPCSAAHASQHAVRSLT